MFHVSSCVRLLLQFSRWTLLIAGISYGAIRHSRLTVKETRLREEARLEAIRMAPILKAEKERLQKGKYYRL